LNEEKKNLRRKALGRGLEAILPEIQGDRPGSRDRGVTMVPITLVVRNPHQARQVFTKESLESLAHSMKEHGIIQPLIVRPQAGGKYEIVAGERRWRAAQLAGLPDVPVIVRQLSEKEAGEINLIENLHRDDLNPMEVAEKCRQLIGEHGYTQEQLAEQIGKSRSALTNLLRLLDLPMPVQEMVRTGRLTEGHARALLRIEQERTRIKLAMEVAAKQLSVRETEILAARLAGAAASPAAEPKKSRVSPEIRELCGRLQRKLGTKVDVRHSRRGSGRMEIYYRSLDELDRILAQIFRR
jgi:ParB family chromosome partitioning protein